MDGGCQEERDFPLQLTLILSAMSPGLPLNESLEPLPPSFKFPLFFLLGKERVRIPVFESTPFFLISQCSPK